jgi:glycosyltransferase involved in cell wall biosynthesis
VTPQTSVIIPCYNVQDYLPQALGSVRRQTRPVREIILVDDGSRVPIQAPADWAGPPLRVIRTENRGLAAARNTGARYAGGAYLAYLDADDFWHPSKVERQEDALAADPEAIASFTRCVRTPGFFSFGPYPPTDVADDEFLLVLWYNSFFPPSTLLVRREALARVGPFREGMGNGEDVELFVRLLTVGRFAQVSEELTYYRIHPQQFTVNPVRKLLGFKEARAVILGLHQERFERIGIPRQLLWDAYRCDILMVYYRRDFAAARRLLWDYWKDHPRDVRILAYAALTLLPARIVTRLRGSAPPPASAATGDSAGPPLLDWNMEVARIKRRLGLAG